MKATEKDKSNIVDAVGLPHSKKSYLKYRSLFKIMMNRS